MKTKFAATALILATGLIAGTSFAATSPNSDASFYDFAAIPSTLTREAVQSEYLAARKNGTLPKQSATAAVALMSGHSDAATPSTVTREAVQSEYLAARKNGALPKQSVTAAVAFMSGRSV